MPFDAESDATESAYPERPLRFIIPYAKDGPGDRIARLIGGPLGERLGQPVLFENLPGKGGTLGTAAALVAPADGHTLLLMASPHTINPSLYPGLPYDTLTDFRGVTLMITMPNVLVVSPGLPVADLRGLMAHARANPGRLRYGSSGTGTPSHLGAELMKTLARLDIAHVPCAGHAEAGAALRRGDVDMLFDAMLMALPEVRAGTVRALGVTSARRAALAPDIPTLDESGLPGFDFSPGVGVLVRSETPRPLVRRLNEEISAILREPAVAASLAQRGAQTVANAPTEFDRYVAQEVARWAEVVRVAGLSPDG